MSLRVCLYYRTVWVLVDEEGTCFGYHGHLEAGIED